MPPGHAFPFLLLAGFRALVDDLNARLAAAGHPDVRPVHGFALQAVGPDGATTSELAARLGVSKQAAAKTVRSLEALGYVALEPHPADARARRVVATARGVDMLRRSAQILVELHAEWVAAAGAEDVAATARALAALADGRPARTDLAGWLGG